MHVTKKAYSIRNSQAKYTVKQYKMSLKKTVLSEESLRMWVITMLFMLIKNTFTIKITLHILEYLQISIKQMREANDIGD